MYKVTAQRHLGSYLLITKAVGKHMFSGVLLFYRALVLLLSNPFIASHSKQKRMHVFFIIELFLVCNMHLCHSRACLIALLTNDAGFHCMALTLVYMLTKEFIPGPIQFCIYTL